MLKVELSEQVWVEIMNLLAQGAYVRVAPILAELNKQLTEQKKADLGE